MESQLTIDVTTDYVGLSAPRRYMAHFGCDDILSMRFSLQRR